MSEDQLCSVVRRGQETKDLDYKAAMAWDERDKAACCGLVKDVLAMANTLGGYIVIGVSEVEPGRRWSWDGVSDKQLATWDTSRVNRFIQNYADPPINAALRKVECDGKCFVVLTVPRFRETPHICQRDFPSVLATAVVYVRTDSNESAPLQRSADFRSVIERAVRTRQDEMLEAMRAILTGAAVTTGPADRERFNEQASSLLRDAAWTDPYASKQYKGYLISFMSPARFQDKRFSIDSLRQAAQAAQISYRGWPFLYYQLGDRSTVIQQDGLQTLVAQQWGGYDNYYFWALRQSGLLIHKYLPHEEARALKDEQGHSLLDPNTVIYYVTESIDALIHLYSSLGVTDEDITWRIRITGAGNRRLKPLDPFRGLLGDWHVAGSDTVEFERAHPIEEWRAGQLESVVEACRELFVRFQWVDAPDSMIRAWATKLMNRQL